MTKKNKAVLWENLKKDAIRFAWYLGMQLIVFGLNFLLANAEMLSLPPLAVVTIGLVLSQVTKHLNS